MTCSTQASGKVKCDLLLKCCMMKYLEKQVKHVKRNVATFAEVLVSLQTQYSSYESDLSNRTEPGYAAKQPNSAHISDLLADPDKWVGQLTPRSYGSNELFFWLLGKLPRNV